MKLTYDPGDNQSFWDAIRCLPGYPQDEVQPIRTMLFASGALERLPEVLEEAGADRVQPVLVVMDSTAMLRTGASLKPQVLEVLQDGGWQLIPFILAPDATGQVHTELSRIEAVKNRLQPGMSVLSVGSGVVTDIAKHAAYLFDRENGGRLPYVVYQTANSVSAYTSNMAPTFIEGVKRTLASRYPDALVCDLETLRDAPPEMTAAGVGDLLAAYVSFPDWYLAHQLGLDPGYTGFPQALMGPVVEIFSEQAAAIRSGELEGVAVLAKMIALGGLAMSLAHATTPMSGYEHVMSHVLDLENETTGRPLAQHGSQVALATILGVETYRHFLDEFDPQAVDLEACYPDPVAARELILSEYGSLDPSGAAGEECWADYRIKLEAWGENRPRLETFLRDWSDIRTQVEALTIPAERLVEILRGVGAPLRFADLVPPFDEAQVRFAYFNAPLMRRRLTIGDLLIFFRWDRERLWEQIWRRSQGLGGV